MNKKDIHHILDNITDKISSEEFSFFGIEIELWKIDDSIAAPRFNVVVKPNEWSKNITSKSSPTQITETKKITWR